jgi:hypothetical protein
MLQQLQKLISLMYKDKCMFVCMELMHIHISEPIWTRLCTRLPLGLEEVVGYVWTRNSWPLRPLASFPFGGHCRMMGTRRLPARPFSVIPLYPWTPKSVLVASYGMCPATPPRSSATAFRLLLLHVFVWRHAHDAVARDNCAFLFSCTVCDAKETRKRQQHAGILTWKPDNTWGGS